MVLLEKILLASNYAYYHQLQNRQSIINMNLNAEYNHFSLIDCQGSGSGSTTALIMHCYLYCVYCLTQPTALSNSYTQNLHRLDSAYIQDQNFMCWKHAKHFDHSQENKNNIFLYSYIVYPL